MHRTGSDVFMSNAPGAALLLRHSLGLEEEARAVETAVDRARSAACGPATSPRPARSGCGRRRWDWPVAEELAG